MAHVRVLVLVAFLTLLAGLGVVQGQQMKSMEFKDQDIRAVLMAMAELSGVSIVPDETVQGKITYFFGAMDFNQALQLFLDAFGYYSVREGNVYYISKIKITVDKEKKQLSLVTVQTPLHSILKKVSLSIGKTILYDSLPNDLVSFTMEDVSFDGFLKTAIARYPEFSIENSEAYYYLRKKGSDQTVNRGGGSSRYFQITGDRLSVNIDKGRFREVVIDLLGLAKKEFVLLIERDSVIENIYFDSKSFEDVLKALLLVAGADYSIVNDVYYIQESQKRDLTRNYTITSIIELKNITTQEFQRLLPPSLSGGNAMRTDEKTGRLVLSGNTEEIKPLLNFIALVDVPARGASLTRFDLKYVKTDELFPLLPSELSSLSPQALPGKVSFIIAVPESRRLQLENLIALVDKPANVSAINLKYVKSEEILQSLPPGIPEGSLLKSRDPSLIFFRGSKEQLGQVLEIIAKVDTPKPLLRYEVLVVKYEDMVKLKIDGTVVAEKTPEDKIGSDGAVALGKFMDLLSLNLDLISGFGYSFGLGLSADLQDNKAKVITDTTLSGLAGEKISIQNSGTFRYQTTITDNVTNANKQVVNELSSGLFINLEGWVSGDGMITVTIDATLSEQRDTGSAATALPSTNEKKIKTTVRTLSGKPIAIGGLKEDIITSDIKKTPLLGDIPLLGSLFKKDGTKDNQAEFVIYIVPHVERDVIKDQSIQMSEFVSKLRKAVEN